MTFPGARRAARGTVRGAKQAAAAKRGFNKDHRPDLRQLCAPSGELGTPSTQNAARRPSPSPASAKSLPMRREVPERAQRFRGRSGTIGTPTSDLSALAACRRCASRPLCGVYARFRGFYSDNGGGDVGLRAPRRTE
jgi:hypothetical protein